MKYLNSIKKGIPAINDFTCRGHFLITFAFVMILIGGLWSNAWADPITSVDPTSLHFSPSDNSLTFTISNTGDGEMTWSIADDKPWLTVNPANGTTMANETVQITVTVDRNDVPAGEHTGTITITSNGGNKTVAVTLSVKKLVDQWPFDDQKKAHCYNHGIGGYQWVGPLFHGGIDIPKAAGTDVFSVIEGVLYSQTPSGENGSVSVAPTAEGPFAWHHYHLDNIPGDLKDVVNDGAANAGAITKTTKIGEVFLWNGLGGVVDHIHLTKTSVPPANLHTIINPLHELDPMPGMAAKLDPALFKIDTDNWQARPTTHDFNTVVDGARVIKDDVDIVSHSTTDVTQCAGAEKNKAEINAISYRVQGLGNVAGKDINERYLMDWTVISSNFSDGGKADLVYDKKHNTENNKFYFNYFLVTNCGKQTDTQIRAANDATVNVMKNAWQTAVDKDKNDDDAMTGPTGTGTDDKADKNADAKYPDGRYRVTTKARVFLGSSGSKPLGSEKEQEDLVYVNNFSQTIDPSQYVYYPGDSVCVTGTQYLPNSPYAIYLTAKTDWSDHAAIPPGSFITETGVVTDSSGNIPLTMIWDSYMPNGVPDTGYVIVVDYDKDSAYHLPREGHTIDAINHIISTSGVTDRILAGENVTFGWYQDGQLMMDIEWFYDFAAFGDMDPTRQTHTGMLNFRESYPEYDGLSLYFIFYPPAGANGWRQTIIHPNGVSDVYAYNALGVPFTADWILPDLVPSTPGNFDTIFTAVDLGEYIQNNPTGINGGEWSDGQTLSDLDVEVLGGQAIGCDGVYWAVSEFIIDPVKNIPVPVGGEEDYLNSHSYPTDLLIAEHHSNMLPVGWPSGDCCEVAGDANHDSDVNVGDAVYGIGYVFKGGPAPSCFNEADVNLDCEYNIGDVVYLINYVFKTGPTPTCGCVD